MKFYLRFLLIIVCFYAISESIVIAQNNYAASLIAPELKVNAKAVVRLHETTITIISNNKATTRNHFIITILNDNGRELSLFRQGYDRFSSISNIEYIIYDSNGKKLKKIPRDEIYDFSASSYAGYEDNRIKLIDPEIRTYPFTVEYSFEFTQSFLLNFPDWQPYIDYNTSVEKSIYKIITDNDSTFQYLERNLINPLSINKIQNNIEYLWQCNNLPAIRYEPFSNEISEYTPSVFISPNEFKYDDNIGDMKSWKNFGLWVYNLNKNRDDLPEEFQQKIKKMVESVQNDIEKVNILYKYMQNNTRYVSEQIGIGGYQTFEAERVHRLGYGDCKALTNYMKAMLKTIGIKSFYTLIYAGNDAPGIIDEFPSNQFNHVMLFVPFQNDTLWIECTNQSIPCGYGGTFTDDRDALVIKEDGGILIHKPAFKIDQNIQYTKANIFLDDTGNGHGEIAIKNKGEYFDYARSIMESDDSDKKKKLYNSLNIPNFSINGFSFKADSIIDPTIDEIIKIELTNYWTKMGNNVLFTLNLTNKLEVLPKRVENRLSDIFIKRSRIEIDTINYYLPDSMTISSLPNKIEINSDFGSYSTVVIYNDRILTYIRTLKLNKGTYPKNDYSKLVEFFSKITDADQKKIVMKPL